VSLLFEKEFALRVKVIKALWLFCPAENALQNGGVLPGSLGRALVQYVWGQDVDRFLKLGNFASTT